MSRVISDAEEAGEEGLIDKAQVFFLLLLLFYYLLLLLLLLLLLILSLF
jgi:hypothetical protein